MGVEQPLDEHLREQEDQVARRRLSFGEAARAYATYRPRYPVDAARWVVGDGVDVVDVGAGTGLLTGTLRELGVAVIAVEPDAGMREELHRTLPEVPVLPGTGEHLPLPDASADAVLFGQSWHWVDPPRASAEVARVLRPGGRLGLVWNIRDDSVPWMAALSAIIGGEDSMERRDGERGHEVAPPFGPTERAEFPHRRTMSPETLRGLVETFSYVRLSPRRDEVLEAVSELVRTHPDLAGRDTFELSYITVVYRAVRG